MTYIRLPLSIYPYLLRNLVINRSNQVWSIDITYIGTPSGFVYLTAIIDWHSRFIVGYTISNTMQSDMVTRTVKKAVERYGAPEIINSDQGSQFTSNEYIERIIITGITHSLITEAGSSLNNIHEKGLIDFQVDENARRCYIKRALDRCNST